MSIERPILFSAPMVRAILSGAKTQTRRAIKKQPNNPKGPDFDGLWSDTIDPVTRYFACPYGSAVDRLYVRESYYQVGHWEPVPGVKTKGGRMKWKFVPDSAEIRFEQPGTFRKGRHSADPHIITWHKRLARFMPRTASRITLEIVSVRVERLQDIGKDGRKAKDVLAEGITQDQIDHWAKWLHPDDAPAHTYGVLWESINGKGSWAANPFVWAIEFKRL